MNCENQAILDHVLVYAHIKDIRRIAGLGFQHAHSIVLDKLAYWTLLVVAIAENARADRTNLDASRLQPLGNAVVHQVHLSVTFFSSLKKRAPYGQACTQYW